MQYTRAALVTFLFSGAVGLAQLADSPADRLVDQNHYKRARTVVSARLRENPNDAHALFLSSKIQEALGNLRLATAQAEQSIAIDGNNPDYHAQLAECYAYMADRMSAVKALSYVHQMKKELAATFALRAHDTDALLVAMMFAFHAPAIAGGDHHKAHEMADEMVAHDARWGYLAQARLAQEDATDEVKEKWLKKAVQTDPKHYRAWQELSNFYCCVATRKNPAEAERAGKEMLRLDPGQTGGYNALASAYARAQRWGDLEAVLAQAEKAVPDDLAPYYFAAQALIDSGQDFARAEKYLGKYVSQDPEGKEPDRGQAKWLLAALYEKNGRTPDAIRELEAAVRISPDFEPARKDLKRLRRS